MKKLVTLLIIVSCFIFDNAAQAFDFDSDYKKSVLNPSSGPFVLVPELYFGAETDDNKLFYALSIAGGCYGFGIKAGEYDSKIGTLLANGPTTRLTAGWFDSGLLTILGGADINNKTGEATPVIEARFIWPLIIYEEAQVVLHPADEEIAFRNRLGLGWVFAEIAWEYEASKTINNEYSRHGIFIGICHILTISIGEDYIYGGLRLAL